MRIPLLALLFLLFKQLAFATGQTPDYIICGQDTLSLFTNPLEQYFTLVGNRDIPDFNGGCKSTSCWRGYSAIWEIKHDSLFLRRITACQLNCGNPHDGNLTKMFGVENVFAFWYSGDLLIPKGNQFLSFNMGYASLYEFEEHIAINKGIVKNKSFISNLNQINIIKQNQILSEKIINLNDTFIHYLNDAVNWEKLDNSKNNWCDDEYILSYDSRGRLLNVKMFKTLSETLNKKKSSLYKKLDQKCSPKLKKSLTHLSLEFLKPHRSFDIRIWLFYNDKLEIWECELYYLIPTEKELQNWVKEQITPK